MSTAILGSGSFLDACAPLKGKTDWGMDSLVRKMVGARALAEAFIATLAQGQGYNGFYLQAWEPDDNPTVSTITLLYKGLTPGGTPSPDRQNEIVPAKGSVSQNYSSENEGRGRIYKYNIWRSFLQLETGAQIEVVNGSLPVYTTGATKEFTYNAAQTRYRYIAVGEPSTPQHSTIGFVHTPTPKNVRIVTADGSVYGENAPSAFSTLNPVVTNRVIEFLTSRIFGTPYFEVQEIVRQELGES